jgi:phytanoyl-CoA hydroxylase
MNDQMATDPVLEDYNRNGFVVFKNVIDAAMIAEARQHVEWLQRRHSSLRPEHLHHPLMRDDAFWVRLVTDARLAAIAERFLGPDLACFTAHYICKPPGDGQAVLWHQDGAYWNLDPMEAVTIWVAIDDCDPENGCLRMIPGTHRNEMGEVVLRNDVPNMLCSSINPRLVNEGQAVDVSLRAGDVEVHHPLIIHGSEANRSTRRRCGLDIGYIRTSTRIGDTGLYLNPILVQGKAVQGINQYRRWPEYEPSMTVPFRGCEQWSEFAREQNKRLGVADAPADREDVGQLAARMISRLQAGTTKSVQARR